MFPRRKRLVRDAFPVVLKGRRVVSPHFSATFSKDAQGYAIVVSKKVARLSVTRHRIKRQVLEALRTLPLPSSALILFPTSAVSEMKYQELHSELAMLLSKIRQ